MKLQSSVNTKNLLMNGKKQLTRREKRTKKSNVMNLLKRTSKIQRQKKKSLPKRLRPSSLQRLMSGPKPESKKTSRLRKTILRSQYLLTCWRLRRRNFVS